MSTKSLEKRAKRAAGAVLRAALPSRRLAPESADWDAVERVLLVRQDRRIGDLVMNTPLFHGARRRFPRAHIALLLREGYEELFSDDPDLDELVPFGQARHLYNPLGLAALVSRLRRGRYDLAIDCSNFKSFSLTNGLLTLLSGAPLRIGFDDKESPAFLNVLVPCGEQRHYAVNQLELLRPTGAAGLSSETSLHLSEELKRRGRRAVEDLCGPDGTAPVLVFTGAGNRLKRWSLERYLEVAEAIRSHGMSVLLAAAPGDPTPGGGSPRSRGGDFRVLPRLSIGEFAGAILASRAFICGDTGPMHIGVACRVPTVSVFLEDNVERYGYNDGRRNISVRVRDDEAGVKEVTQAALRLLAETPT